MTPLIIKLLNIPSAAGTGPDTPGSRSGVVKPTSRQKSTQVARAHRVPQAEASVTSSIKAVFDPSGSCCLEHK